MAKHDETSIWKKEITFAAQAEGEAGRAGAGEAGRDLDLEEGDHASAEAEDERTRRHRASRTGPVRAEPSSAAPSRCVAPRPTTTVVPPPVTVPVRRAEAHAVAAPVACRRRAAPPPVERAGDAAGSVAPRRPVPSPRRSSPMPKLAAHVARDGRCPRARCRAPSPSPPPGPSRSPRPLPKRRSAADLAPGASGGQAGRRSACEAQADAGQRSSRRRTGSPPPQARARRRPEDRRLADRGRLGRQQGRARASSGSRARRCRRASSSAASCASRSELAAALKTLFRKNKLPQTCVRLGIANNRIGVRTFEIAGIDDPRPARERGPLPRPGDAADPARRGSARLPDPRRQRRRATASGLPRAARRRPPRARRALRRRLPQGRAEARSGSTSRPSRSSARSPTPPSGRLGCRSRLRRDRPRPLDARRLGRPRLRVHPRARVGRLRPRRRARARCSTSRRPQPSR